MAKEKPQLTEQQRAERVLTCLGRGAGLSLPGEVQTSLAALCGDDGFIKAGCREDAEKVLHDYWDSQKAVVDPPPAEEVNDGRS